MQPLFPVDASPPPAEVFETLHRLFEDVPSFVAVVVGPEYRYIFSNRKNRELLGREDMLGLTLAEVVPELVEQGFGAIMDGVYASGEAYIGHGVPLRPAGDPVPLYLDFIYQPIFDDRRKVIGVVSVGHDVTEHCEALQRIGVLQSELLGVTEELRGENSRFRRTLDHLPHMIWSTRPDGYHDYFSRAWYEFTAVPEGSTDGEGWNDLFHPDDRARAWPVWGEALRTGDPYFIEYRLRHRSGSYRWVVGRAWAERNGAGEIVRWYGTCTDIDDRVTAQQRVAELQSELMHISRLSAMGSMAATLAHEVNQPLTAVTSYAAALRRLIDRGAPEKELLEVVSSIENAGLRAGEIIRRLRDMAKRRKPSRVRVLARDLVREASALAVAAGCGNVEPTLRCPADIVLYADPVQVQQVLTNLIKNACEAVEGRDDAEVVVSVRTNEGGEIQFAIEDNGDGIADALLSSIFDTFFTTKEEGMGIGLAVSRTIVEAGGGRIWAENRAEGGARFCFTLPAPR